MRRLLSSGMFVFAGMVSMPLAVAPQGERSRRRSTGTIRGFEKLRSVLPQGGLPRARLRARIPRSCRPV